MVSEVGAASRAWVDYPGRLWTNAAQMGAIYPPDAMTIQLDNGTIWQRALNEIALIRQLATGPGGRSCR